MAKTLKDLKVDDSVFMGTFDAENPLHMIGSDFTVIKVKDDTIVLKRGKDEGTIELSRMFHNEFASGENQEVLINKWNYTPHPQTKKKFYTGIFTTREIMLEELKKVVQGNAEMKKKFQEHLKKREEASEVKE